MVPASVLIALLVVGFLWYRLLTKMGFKEPTLWILLIMLFFPLTCVFAVVYLAFVPWPIHKELKNVKTQQRSHSPYQPVDEIDVELDRMRGDMGLNQMKKRKRDI
jgi:peptidoglycan/LPS O-acetylase OafA/YrhL